MNDSDRLAALSLAQEPQNRRRDAGNPSGENVGGLRFRKTNGEPYGADAAALLERNNGTIIWDMEDPINGCSSFDNIHQYAAAEIYAAGGTLRNRFEASQEFEQAARSGFNSLASWMLDIWGAPLFRLKSPGSGNKITVITVHPDYVPEWSDKTALDLMREKDRKQIEGQMMAARKRLSREFEDSDVARLLNQAVQTCLSRTLPSPKRTG